MSASVLMPFDMKTGSFSLEKLESQGVKAKDVKTLVVKPPVSHKNVSISSSLLAGFPSLEVLVVDDCIMNFPWSEVPKMNNVKQLVIYNTGLRSFSGIAAAVPNVAVLEAKMCHAIDKKDGRIIDGVVSLEGIDELVDLHILDVSGTRVTNVEPLETCVNLQAFHAADCRVLTSLHGLEDHFYLHHIDVTNTDVDSLQPIRNCVNLETVILTGSRRIRTVRYLTELTRLKEVSIKGTAIADARLLANRVGLPSVKVSS